MEIELDSCNCFYSSEIESDSLGAFFFLRPLCSIETTETFQADSLIAGDKQVRQALKEAAEHQKVAIWQQLV